MQSDRQSVKTSAIALPPSLNMRLITMLQQQYGSFNTSYFTDIKSARPLSIERVEVNGKQYSLYVSKSVMWLDTKTAKPHYFTSVEDAKKFLLLRDLGKSPSAIPLVCNGQMATLHGSIFEDAPIEVKEYWLDDECYLKSQMDYVWYFTWNDEISVRAFAFECAREAIAQFAILAKEDPSEDYEF
jgi:hypothetical protein